jgi:hypothetical protein
MSAGLRMASRPRTRSGVTSCARCASCNVRRLNRRLSLCQSGAVHSQPIRSTGSSSGPDRKPAWRSKRTLTCSVTPAATRWRTPGTIPARCRITSDTKISSKRCGIPSSHRPGSKISGARVRDQGRVSLSGCPPRMHWRTYEIARDRSSRCIPKKLDEIPSPHGAIRRVTAATYHIVDAGRRSCEAFDRQP